MAWQGQAAERGVVVLGGREVAGAGVRRGGRGSGAWGRGGETRGAWRLGGRVARVLGAVVLASVGMGLGGCETLTNYANLRNGFLAPNEVGRFSKGNPFYAREAKPVKWPILETIDVIDEPNTRWANATDPTAADLVPEIKEQVLGPGDAIQVSVYELIQPGTDYVKQVRINEYGVANIAGVGSVKAGGLTPSQLEEKIGQVLLEEKLMPLPGPGQPGPQVSVLVLDSRQRLFSVLGSVGRPGTYNILSFDFRLLDAIALIGDIPVQPGMDYLYIIRQTPYSPTPATAPAPGPGPGETGTSAGGQTPGASAADILQEIERGTTQPGTTTEPASEKAPETGPGGVPSSGPSSSGPRFVRPLPTAMVMSSGEATGPVLAQAEMDAALGMPGAASAPAPAASRPGGENKDLLGRALGAGTTTAPGVNYIYLDGKRVEVKGSTRAATPAAASTQPGTTLAATPGTIPGTMPGAMAGPGPEPTGAATTGPATAAGGTPEALTQQRVIRIPIAALREGVSKYNVVIRPGDIINVPPVEPGEFYLMGHVARPGVYTLTGRKITLKQAVASAGGLDAVAIPRRCDLIRRIGTDQEATVQVNLQAIFDGEQPDLFLKPYDVVNVGTDAVAPFLAVMRNAYRASYGWGFTYDQNFNTSNNNGS